ncbi:MAG: glycosyltransferase family 4 protein [Planctomycetes bacterium]|nr:glycosyltransferase family 4 protein [Planctomycetota bacterium]
MHVAYIHQHFSTKRGATGTRSYEMSRHLIEAGHRVTMICGAYAAGDSGDEGGGRISEQDVDGIHVLRVNQRYGNEMGFAKRVLAFGRFARTAGKLVNGLDADLVFATSTPLTVGIPGMKGARRLGVPFVFEVRDRWPELPIALGVIKNPALIWYLKRMEKRIYRAAEKIIALSPGLKEGVCSTGYPTDRVVMVPNGCDLNLFQPSDDRLDDERFGAKDDFKLVFTGAHGLANGLDAVLDAALEFKRRDVRGVRFVFIGQGRERERLIERSRNEGTDSIISWVRSIPKEELATVLPRMDAGMMILKNVPAFYYGTSPNKFFDYIAGGLPVLNNYPGWLAGMIDKRRCGVVVRPDDPRAFADAVLWMRDHPVERKEMGRRGRELAESDFSRDRLACEFTRTLEAAKDSFRASR